VTFVEIQDAVMGRFDLTTSVARTRVKARINERYRELVTSLGLGKVRRATSTFATVDGTTTYTPTNLIKPFTVTYTAGNRVLLERTEAQIREQDPDISQTGAPRYYVVVGYGASTVSLRIYPTPDDAYTITYEGIVRGTALSSDGDIPVLPEDFHDILVLGPCEDEALKQEKTELARQFRDQRLGPPGRKHEGRVGELRYFLHKSAYLHTRQGQDPWWYGPYNSGVFGWGL
jgi:hypothetical protein